MPLTFRTKVGGPFTARLRDGQELTVCWRDDYGGFYARHGDVSRAGATVAVVVGDIQQAVDQQHASTARARQLRERAKTPTAALLLPDLTPIGIRGVAEQSGYVLITYPDGRKAKVSRRHVLRMLTGEERARLDAARARAEAARARLDELGEPMRGYAASDALDVTAEITYDETEAVFVATVHGHQLATGGTRAAVMDAAARVLVRVRWPFGIVFDVDTEEYAVVSTAECSGLPYALFTTREAAEGYVARTRARDAAQRDLDELTWSYRLILVDTPELAE